MSTEPVRGGRLDHRIVQEILNSRNIDATNCSSPRIGLGQLKDVANYLDTNGHYHEAEALLDAYNHCKTQPDFGGLGYPEDSSLDDAQAQEVLFFVSAYLEALNYQDRNATRLVPSHERPAGRRGMTLAEKIFAAHDISGKGEVKPQDVIRLDVDWVIASELSWYGMDKTYQSLGAPGIFRNDRLWIAGDHVVDPRVMDHPKIKPLVEASEKARKVFKMTENQGMNYTIMHTEFCRERAQPGMLVIGSDSHTCSAGSVSCLAIGLGVADVVLPLVTGETWIKVPETLEIRFINQPRVGMGGKDIILYILKELKRNTVAAERVVEFTGPGLQSLSCDARFAICNMCTEFGAITGVCVPDEITQTFINRRKTPKHKKLAQYYKPDADAQYADSYTIDLSKVEPYIARYPSPDDVVPVAHVEGTALDGCFIGACTTAREDLVLASLVLEVGLAQGMRPTERGIRKVVPGSRPILHELRKLGVIQIFEQAGFQIGVPSCSYCVGMSADKAGKGEVWLSSQNRNFENRMGPGAIGSITSAVTVAASSFNMVITDPAPLLDQMDQERMQHLLRLDLGVQPPIEYVEPPAREVSFAEPTKESKLGAACPDLTSEPDKSDQHKQDTSHNIICGRAQTLGDFIDTDALAPAEALVGNLSPAELGEFCLCHTHPEFRQRAKDGLNVVVAGNAFGVGSSRENAVTALLGIGIQCVIARSFAFIYARNQPNLGLLGIVMRDDAFYEVAVDGVEIEIRVDERVIQVGENLFNFTLSDLEIRLWKQGGLSSAFAIWGKQILEKVTAPSVKSDQPRSLETSKDVHKLSW